MDFSLEQAVSNNARSAMTIDADLNLDVEDNEVIIVTIFQLRHSRGSGNDNKYVVIENNQTAFISSAILKITIVTQSASGA